MSAPMKSLDLTGKDVTIAGAVSLEVSAAGVKPWRLPFDEMPLFHEALISRAASAAGVRIAFISDTRRVVLGVAPVEGAAQWTFDLTVDGELAKRVTQATTMDVVDFGEFATSGPRLVQIHLPSQYVSIWLRSLHIDINAVAYAWHDARPRWVVYGSSITHAKEAAGPTETWAALVAKQFNLNHTNLGYGGNEHLEPQVAKMIARMPADYLSMCVGGNIWGSDSYSSRTYKAALLGFIDMLRSAHPRTPLAVLSFIHTVHDQDNANKLGAKVEDYRKMTRDAVEVLRTRGDDRLFYVPGPDLFGPDDMPLMNPDKVHPSAEGQRLLGKRFAEQVMPRLLAMGK